MQTIIVIPTYNEKENIEPLAQQILSLPIDLRILIVDDSSPDGTGRIADRLARENERIMVLHRVRKEGLGSAYIEGFSLALKTPASYFMEMDADFSHSPNDIPRLLEELEEADMVIGSRYVKGGMIINWSIVRRFLSLGANFLTRIVLKVPVKDSTSGYRIFRKEVLKSLPLKKVRAKGFAFQIEMLYYVHRKRFKIKEIPITFTNRGKGSSKLVFAIIWEILLTLLRLKIFRKIA